MDDKEQHDATQPEQEDQYSRPASKPRGKAKEKGELGPNATQLLGILNSLQDNES